MREKTKKAPQKSPPLKKENKAGTIREHIGERIERTRNNRTL